MAFRYSKFRIDRSHKGKVKRTFEGVEFDSSMELYFYRDHLLPLKNKGEIENIILQPVYVLQPGFLKYSKRILPIKYIGDFEVKYSDGRIVTYDVKGLPTQDARLKKKMFDFVFPDKVLIWIALSVQDGGWIEFSELQKMKSKRKKEKKANGG